MIRSWGQVVAIAFNIVFEILSIVAMNSQQIPEHEYIAKYIKLVLIGQSGVGKTNIISRYVEDKFSLVTTTTIGLEYSQKFVNINKQHMIVQVWDTAGQERFRALNKTFYYNSLGALVIFDLSNRESFNELDRWILELRENVAETAVFLLVGNKSDLSTRKVTVSEAFQMAKREGMGYIQTSAATGVNIQEAFQMLLNKIVQKVESIKSQKTAQSKPINIQPKRLLEASISKKKKKKNCCL